MPIVGQRLVEVFGVPVESKDPESATVRGAARSARAASPRARRGNRPTRMHSTSLHLPGLPVLGLGVRRRPGRGGRDEKLSCLPQNLMCVVARTLTRQRRKVLADGFSQGNGARGHRDHFGTARSGYAFAFATDNNKEVRVRSRWPDQEYGYVKTLTHCWMGRPAAYCLGLHGHAGDGPPATRRPLCRACLCPRI